MIYKSLKHLIEIIPLVKLHDRFVSQVDKSAFTPITLTPILRRDRDTTYNKTRRWRKSPEFASKNPFKNPLKTPKKPESAPIRPSRFLGLRLNFPGDCFPGKMANTDASGDGGRAAKKLPNVLIKQVCGANSDILVNFWTLIPVLIMIEADFDLLTMMSVL